MHYLLEYSPRFSLALALWPLASLVCTLPILAILYRRDGRLRFWSVACAYIVVFYLLGLACFTLYPLPSGNSGPGITYGVKPNLDFWLFARQIRSWNKSAIFELLANVALFVPFGFIVARGAGWGPVRSTLAGFAVSLLVETTQLTGVWHHYAYAYRTFDVDDLLTNTTGAFVGWACAAVFTHFVPYRIEPEALEPTHSPSIVRRMVAFVLDMVLTWVVAMVFIVVAQYVLRHYFADWRHFARMMDLVSRWSFRAMLVFFEFLVPLAWKGRTLGGSFVRMSCETRPRRGLLRVVFFVVRLAVFYLVVKFPAYALAALLVWWVVFRAMPYDMLPASRELEPEQG
jgi:glycopeptide antibiotics resistance protein